jgi:hypothetical protein
VDGASGFRCCSVVRYNLSIVCEHMCLIALKFLTLSRPALRVLRNTTHGCRAYRGWFAHQRTLQRWRAVAQPIYPSATWHDFIPVLLISLTVARLASLHDTGVSSGAFPSTALCRGNGDAPSTLAVFAHVSASPSSPVYVLPSVSLRARSCWVVTLHSSFAHYFGASLT